MLNTSLSRSSVFPHVAIHLVERHTPLLKRQLSCNHICWRVARARLPVAVSHQGWTQPIAKTERARIVRPSGSRVVLE